MAVDLLREPVQNASVRSRALAVTTIPVLGLLDVEEPASVEALLREPLPWDGLILPIAGSASGGVGLSLGQAASLLRDWPAAIPWIAGPMDLEAWRACEPLKPQAYYMNGAMSRASQWPRGGVPRARPCLLTANGMTEKDIASVVRMVLPVQGLVVEPSSPLFSRAGVAQLYELTRWGWPVSYLCDLEGAAEVLPALCGAVSSIVLRVRQTARAGERRTAAQRVAELRRCFGLVSPPVRSSFQAARSLGPEALDRIDRTRPTLVAARRLRCGEALAPDAVRAEQGTHGVSAELVAQFDGSKVCYELQEGEPITFGHVGWAEAASPPRGARLPSAVSVVVRSKNEASWIERCLRAIQLQRGVGRVEIIVVDNESVDGTADLARALGCTVSSISDTEFTYGRALNRGIEMARGEFVAILSAHCVPVNDRWLLRLLANFRAPAVVGVYGRQIPLPDSNDFDKRDLWITFGLDRKIQRGDSFFHNANCMIRRTTWERIRFDETIRGVEDRAWAQHILKVGYRVVYEPYAPVYHHHGIHQGRDEQRAQRVVRVIEMMHRTA